MTHPLNPTDDPQRAAVLEFWQALEAAGYQRPPSLRGQGKAADERLALIDRSLGVWVALTQDAAPRELLAAGLLWLRQDRKGFWPTPGQVLQILQDARKLETLDGDAAWGEVLRAIRRYGTRARPVRSPMDLEEALAEWAARGNTDRSWSDSKPFLLHEDPTTAAALFAGVEALGGWGRACKTSEDTAMADRASFRAAYRTAIERLRARRDVASLGLALGSTNLPALPAPVPDLDPVDFERELDLVRDLERKLGGDPS